MQIRIYIYIYNKIYLVEIHADCAGRNTSSLNTLQMPPKLNIPGNLRRLFWQIARRYGFLMLFNLNFVT